MAGKRWLLITGIVGLLLGAAVFGYGLKRGIREASKPPVKKKATTTAKKKFPMTQNAHTPPQLPAAFNEEAKAIFEREHYQRNVTKFADLRQRVEERKAARQENINLKRRDPSLRGRPRAMRRDPPFRPGDPAVVDA